MDNPKRVKAYCYGSNAKVVRINPLVTLYIREQATGPLLEVGMAPTSGETISGFNFGDFYQYSAGNIEVVSPFPFPFPLPTYKESTILANPPTGFDWLCRSVGKCQSTDGRTVVILNYPAKVLYEDSDCLVMIDY
jgi:hypothetical protein